MTIKEVSAVLKIDLMTAYRWHKKRLLPSFKIGNEVRINKEKFNEMLEKKIAGWDVDNIDSNIKRAKSQNNKPKEQHHGATVRSKTRNR